MLQGSVMAFDEFVLHRRRGLGAWERIGHPIDTFIFLCALIWLLFTEPSRVNLTIFAALSVVSCLIITKDEWEHQKRCEALENWTHALLFILHPVVLGWAGWLWWNGIDRLNLVGAALMVGAFFVYQIVYWNFLNHDQQRVL